MTEGNDDGSSSLVRVRAQVMLRDDSTGGWVPMGSGGLSNVSVRKRILQIDHDKSKYEYFIHAKRISDHHAFLCCTIKKDFEYNKVMPTFHHWRTGDHKCGLAFQSAADGRTFDRGVKEVVDKLLDDMNKIPWFHNRRLDGEDEVFMAVNLPVDRDGSLSSSGSTTTCSNSSRHTPLQASLPTPDHLHHNITTGTTHLTTPDLPTMHVHQLYHHHGGGSNTPLSYVTTNTSPSSTLSTPATITSSSNPPPLFTIQPNKHHIYRKSKLSPTPGDKINSTDGDKLDDKGLESYTYVQLSKATLNEYSFPMVDSITIKGDRRDSIASIKKHQHLELVSGIDPQQPPLQEGKRLKKKSRRSNRKFPMAKCKYCSNFFSEENNPRGGCEYSPDYVRSTINKVSCISCVHGLLYHCMSNAEGEFPNPCTCTEIEDEPCGGKWLCMALLSLVVPCLWCYLPMRACHRCAVCCHLCGGKHEAS